MVGFQELQVLASVLYYADWQWTAQEKSKVNVLVVAFLLLRDRTSRDGPNRQCASNGAQGECKQTFRLVWATTHSLRKGIKPTFHLRGPPGTAASYLALRLANPTVLID